MLEPPATLGQLHASTGGNVSHANPEGLRQIMPSSGPGLHGRYLMTAAPANWPRRKTHMSNNNSEAR
jgi:hypothetical protein